MDSTWYILVALNCNSFVFGQIMKEKYYLTIEKYWIVILGTICISTNFPLEKYHINTNNIIFHERGHNLSFLIQLVKSLNKIASLHSLQLINTFQTNGEELQP